MIIIFFGNTKYSNIGLKIVNTAYPLSLVVTIPYGAVKKLAEELKIPILEADKLNEDTIEKIAKFKADFLIVEDYGLILPKKLLDLPKFAPLNIHPSLLPKYRGPSPAPSAILAGDKISGVTIIKMTEEVDAGQILAQEKYTLSQDETTDSLLTKLNQLGGELVVKVIKQYLDGTVNPKLQDNAIASYCNRLIRQDGYFDINHPPSPDKLDRMIRAYFPWPGVWTIWRVKSQESRVKGKIIKFLPGGKIQMEGKKAVSLQDFINGYPKAKAWITAFFNLN